MGRGTQFAAVTAVIAAGGVLALSSEASRSSAEAHTLQRGGIVDVGLPGTRMIVSHGAPRAGRTFVAMILVVGEEARRAYKSVRFGCDAAYGDAKRKNLRQLTRVRTGLTFGPEPQTVVCAWEIPRGTAGKTVYTGWSWTATRLDDTGRHADGPGLTWRIRS